MAASAVRISDRVGGTFAKVIRARSSCVRFGNTGSTARCVGLKLASGCRVPL